MKDEEIIRKAVELAEGWRLGRNDVLHSPCGYFADLTDQPVLDALAAQLVRQVDAGGKYQLISTDRQCHIGDAVLSTVRNNRGPDRTMNTLRAIVESRVLEEEL